MSDKKNGSTDYRNMMILLNFLIACVPGVVLIIMPGVVLIIERLSVMFASA